MDHDRNTDPETGVRQDVVMDQDLKNGLASVLEFCAAGVKMGGEVGQRYLIEVARHIASGRGYPAPNPGPVTPPQE